jgi:hypothetical protein
MRAIHKDQAKGARTSFVTFLSMDTMIFLFIFSIENVQTDFIHQFAKTIHKGQVKHGIFYQNYQNAPPQAI